MASVVDRKLDGHAETLADVPLDRLGPYVVEQEIGAGGMARVVRARAPNGRAVAIKRIRANIDSESIRQRFIREATIRIQHPNVVEVLDAGFDAAGNPYIVFELLEGETLAAMLRRAPLRVSEAIRIGAQIARGLACAHAGGIVHRDLKPENVFVTKDGTAKVLDFGVALSLDVDRTKLTVPGGVVGTPLYLAPEQARGEPPYDERIDVWALGTLLYESLAGHAPFERDSPLSTLLAIMREEPEPLHRVRPEIPSGFGEIVAQCLTKNRDLRPRTMAFVVDALERASSPTPRIAETARSLAPTAPSESRVVTLLLAESVDLQEKLRGEVELRGGAFFPVHDGRAVGIWGSSVSFGDEAARAAQAVLAARHAAERLALVLGHVETVRGALDGEALRAAECALGRGLPGILVDDATARALGPRFVFTDVGEGMHRLDRETDTVGPGPRDTLVETDAGRSPTVSREGELVLLEDAITRCLDERSPRWVFLVGPPGVGKSRLLAETSKRWRMRGLRTLWARANMFGDRGAFSTMRSALATFVAEEAHERKSDEASVLAELAESSRVEALALDQWLRASNGLASPRSTSASPLVAEDVRVALWDLLSRWLARAPLAIFLEDVQWADDASLALVSELTAASTDAQLLVVGASRREGLDRAQARMSHIELIEPRPLSVRGIVELAASVLGMPLRDELARRIAQHTGGNALYVDQVLREIRARGQPEVLENIPLPVSVEAAIQARLDLLSPVEREVVRFAAVLDRGFTPDLLASFGVANAEDALESLHAASLLERRGGTAGRPEYRAAHAIVAETAYRSIGTERLRDMHTLVATTLRASPSASAEEIAQHYARAGSLDDAARYYERAALRAHAAGDSQSVLRCSGHALEHRHALEKEFELYLARATAFADASELADASRELEAARACSVSAEQRARVACVDFEHVAWRKSVVDAANEAEAVLSMARGVVDPRAFVQALAAATAAYSRVGRNEEAKRACDEMLAAAAPLDGATQALALYNSSWIAWNEGRLHRAALLCEESAKLMRDAGDLGRALQYEAAAADCFGRVGDYARMAQKLVWCAERLLAVGRRGLAGMALLNAADARLRLGDGKGARALVERAMPLHEGNTWTPWCDLVRARCELQTGEPQEALTTLDRFETKAGGQYLIALGHIARSRALLALGRPGEALEAARSAMNVREAIGVLPEDDADAFLALVECLRAHGDEAEASEVLARGRAMLEAAAAKIEDPAWKKRFLEDVPSHRALLAGAGTT